MKNQKGFISISIFIAIIAGILVIGGGGYFGYTQFKNYQNQQVEKEKQAQELAKTQQEALEKSQAEIEKLKEETAQKTKELTQQVSEGKEATKQQQEELEQKQKKLEEKQNELEGQQKKSAESSYNIASIIEQWSPYVASIECEFRYSDTNRLYKTQGGSATLMEIDNISLDSNGKYIADLPYVRALTNKHVLLDSDKYVPRVCYVNLYGYSLALFRQEWGLDFDELSSNIGDISKSTSGFLVDWGTVNFIDEQKKGIVHIKENLLNKFNPADHICGFPDIGELPDSGDEIIILGYPAIGDEYDVTVTRGIISGTDDGYYITDAKIDHGNSGGAAILLKNNCLFGIPTAAVTGEIESLGRILPIADIFLNISMEKTQGIKPWGSL
ncbi:hypothetical protein L6252_04030 [Candidatus Parcubacteria bacterium]|nr:hypothetical protein [Candidatus Parcubacteria bacterium]